MDNHRTHETERMCTGGKINILKGLLGLKNLVDVLKVKVLKGLVNDLNGSVKVLKGQGNDLKSSADVLRVKAIMGLLFFKGFS